MAPVRAGSPGKNVSLPFCSPAAHAHPRLRGVPATHGTYQQEQRHTPTRHVRFYSRLVCYLSVCLCVRGCVGVEGLGSLRALRCGFLFLARLFLLVSIRHHLVSFTLAGFGSGHTAVASCFRPSLLLSSSTRRPQNYNTNPAPTYSTSVVVWFCSISSSVRGMQLLKLLQGPKNIKAIPTHKASSLLFPKQSVGITHLLVRAKIDMPVGAPQQL